MAELDAALAPAEKARLMAEGAGWGEEEAVAAALASRETRQAQVR